MKQCVDESTQKNLPTNIPTNFEIIRQNNSYSKYNNGFNETNHIFE